MNKTPTLLRLLCLITIAVVTCAVATVRFEPAAAAAVNGRIAFTNENTIYSINPDGAALNQLTPHDDGNFDHFPHWSPNGAKIVFARTTFTVKSQIYVMNADGTNPTRLTNNSAADKQPLWSPDATKIAFVSDRDGNDEIYVMNADGSNQTRLTNNTAIDFDLTWSPDGTKIAFTSSRDFPSGGAGLEIYTMGADGSNPIRLTNNTSLDAQPSWSPDGTRIAFTAHRLGLPLVYVMNANGSNQVNITQSATLDSSDAEWSPDGTTIAFTSYARVGFTNSDEIFLMNADGSNIRRLTTSFFDEHELAWQALDTAPPPTPTPTPTPTPSPSPTFTISGTVKDGNGQGIADVTMVMNSNVTGTQITFTNQSGNYSFNYVGGVSSSIGITPSKTGWAFTPLSLTFVTSGTLDGNQTVAFTGALTPIPLFQIPVLPTQENSQRALALDSVTMLSEPFGVGNIHNFSSDQRTRISFFAVGVDLAQGETASVISVQAEDSLFQTFSLPVEHFGPVPNFPWLKQIVVKLPDEIANSFEVRVSVKVRNGFASNKVILKVKP